MPPPQPTRRPPTIRRLWPIALVLAGLAAAYASGLQHLLTFDSLATQQQWLQAHVAAHPILAPLLYVLAYVAVVALSVPGSAILTITGGLLFGTTLGAASAVLGATLGAIAIFLAARYAIGPWLAAKAGPFLEKLRTGLQKDGFSYLLAIRLVPIVPFWLANLAPALAGMRLAPFAAATLLGIIPATIVFASIGAGLGSVLAQGGRPNLSLILRPAILLPLLGLAALSLLPIAVRRWRKPR